MMTFELNIRHTGMRQMIWEDDNELWVGLDVKGGNYDLMNSI